MSSAGPAQDPPPPLIALVHRADRALQADMVRSAVAAGYEHARLAHNWVFGTLPAQGARASDLAAAAGITRQSMGEIVRELVDLGVVTMAPDPTDRRAKLVTYTEAGMRQVEAGNAHIARFEARMRDELGDEGYERLREGLRTVVEVLSGDASP
jgi:DNA-binding MarR family transcriptional regulator